ncbi:SAM-dependent methyltransferase [Microbacterium sp.]|uniref:SAM-dependent methyltransferase n=1 Tax=Microbacterium sp. TaxID=51671 RepID=UPI003F975611
MQISEFRVRRTSATDLLVISQDSQTLRHIPSALRHDTWLTVEAEAVLRDEGLLPQLFDTPEVADIYPGDVTEGEVDFLATFLEEDPTTRALDIGCGVGRILLPLVERGVQVDGLDSSQEAIAFLAEAMATRNLRGNLFVADMAGFVTYPGYDIAFSVMNSFRYVGNTPRAVAHLRCVKQMLAPGGIYILNLAFRPQNEPKLSSSWIQNNQRYTWSKGALDVGTDSSEEFVTIESPRARHVEYQAQYSPRFATFRQLVETEGYGLQRIWSERFEPLEVAEPVGHGNVWVQLTTT